jgi:hypothetical protein
MSGNINDTNTTVIREQVYSMIKDLENKSITVEECQTKYECLYKTSKSLFEIVAKQSYNKHDFAKHLDFVLHQIELIQTKRLSQYNASSNVGYHFAEKYLPKE